jgi:proteasome lid subunit RPN8/RPN11
MRLAGDQVLEVVRGKNVRATSATYELDVCSLIRAATCADNGDGIALYHSHPQTPAEPSPNDVRLAAYPDWRYVIVSLAGTPSVRAWWIRDGTVVEDELTIQD